MTNQSTPPGRQDNESNERTEDPKPEIQVDPEESTSDDSHSDAGLPTPQKSATPPQSSPAEKLSPNRDSQAEIEEEDIWAGRTDYKHFAGRIALFILCSVFVIVGVFWWRGNVDEGADPKFTFGAALLWSLVGIVVCALIFLMKVAMIVLGHRYRITTQRLFVERGILSQTIDQTELVRVDDVRVFKSVMDRIFHLGTVELLSTDATDTKMVIDGVKDAEKVAEHIRSAMHRLRRRSLYVEHL
jgi:membrane protein YdbS with pleckstrin-like domain